MLFKALEIMCLEVDRISNKLDKRTNIIYTLFIGKELLSEIKRFKEKEAKWNKKT